MNIPTMSEIIQCLEPNIKFDENKINGTFSCEEHCHEIEQFKEQLYLIVKPGSESIPRWNVSRDINLKYNAYQLRGIDPHDFKNVLKGPLNNITKITKRLIVENIKNESYSNITDPYLKLAFVIKEYGLNKNQIEQVMQLTVGDLFDTQIQQYDTRSGILRYALTDQYDVKVTSHEMPNQYAGFELERFGLAIDNADQEEDNTASNIQTSYAVEDIIYLLAKIHPISELQKILSIYRV